MDAEERREYRRRRHQAEDLADIVRYWRAALVAELEHEHLAALEAKDWLAWAQIGRELYRVRKASGADLIRQYMTARDTDPEETARLVAIGRDDEAARAGDHGRDGGDPGKGRGGPTSCGLRQS